MKKGIYNTTVRYNDNIHITKNFANLVTPLDIKTTNFSLIKPSISRKYDNIIKTLFSKNKIQKDDWVIIMNINASDLAIERRWSKENFVTLSNHLIEKYNAKIIFIGSKKESVYVKSMIGLIDKNNQNNIIDISGKTNPNELIALFKKI